GEVVLLTLTHSGRVSHVFFFSSRRRHTRFSRDWSSDVCSSDLGMKKVLAASRGAGLSRLLLRSSTLLYWPSVRNPALLREESPFAEGAPEYIRIKREADALALSAWPSAAILRFAPLVGSEAGGWLAKALRAPVDLAIAGFDPLIQCLHVEDASLAIEHALEKELEGIFLVAPEGSLPLLAAYRLSGSYPFPLPNPIALASLRAL